MAGVRYITNITVAAFNESRFKSFAAGTGPMPYVFGGVFGVMVLAVLDMISHSFGTWINAAVLTGFFAMLPDMLARYSMRRKNRKFVREVTDKINNSVTELTGDASQQLTTGRIQSLMTKKKSELLSVNGISGIEVSVSETKSQYNANSHVISVRVPEGDNGIESFDHLVHAAAAHDTDIQSVIGSYRA